MFDTTYLTSSTIRKKKCHLFRSKPSSRLNVVMNLLFLGLFDLEEEDEAIKGGSKVQGENTKNVVLGEEEEEW